VLVFLPGAAVVGAGARFPVWHGGLPYRPGPRAVPFWTRGFDFFEVAVGIAFDVFFAGKWLAWCAVRVGG
jgi:hypothetical protein